MECNQYDKNISLKRRDSHYTLVIAKLTDAIHNVRLLQVVAGAGFISLQSGKKASRVEKKTAKPKQV